MANVLITGCSGGFANDAAKKFAERSHTVYATMRGVDGKNAGVADELRDHADENDLHLHVVELDVTSDDSVRAAVDRVLDEAGHIDVVVNNAGQMFVGITEAFTADDLSRQLDVNVVGPHRVARAALPSMRERGEGLLINVSSIAGRVAIPWGIEEWSEASYGDMNRVLDQVGETFESFFEDEEATDPARIVDTFVELIESSPEERPFRIQVGIDFGSQPLNELSDEVRKQILSEMELSRLEGVTAARTAEPGSEA